MLRGTGATASVIQAAGASGGGVSAEPKALVVEVKTKPSTPAACAASSSASVPETLVSTNACAAWLPTCGLCSVAAWITARTSAIAAATKSRSTIEPAMSVNGDGSRSMPRAASPRAASSRISASPRCPALPVTRIMIAPPPGRATLAWTR